MTGSRDIQPTDALLEPLVEIACAAGKAILKVYETNFEVDKKTDQTPLTAADLAAHRIIVTRLGQLTPALPLISEEGLLPARDERCNWQRYWLVDPLDGTREFVSRNGEFTVNIALMRGRSPVLGVVHAPVSGVTYTGAQAAGAARRSGSSPPAPVRVASHSRDPVRVVASRSHRGNSIDDWLHGIGNTELLPIGSSLKFCLVAEGSADVYPRFGPTSAWDTAAGQAVAEAAGARVLKLDGTPLDYNVGADLLNPHFMVIGPTDRDWLAPGL